MIKFLKDLPANVTGIELTGEITKAQYDEVFPEIDRLAKREGEINYLVKLNTPLKNITAGVWWDDFKLAMRHFSKWHRMAIITNDKVIDKLADIFGFAFPGEAKTFGMAEYTEAVTWVSA